MRAAGAQRTKETDDRHAAISDCGHPRGQSRQPCAPRDPCRLRPPVHNSPGGAARGEEEPRALAPGAPRILIGPVTPRQHPPPRPAHPVTIPGGPDTKQVLGPQHGMRCAPGMTFVGNKDLMEKDEGDTFLSWIYGLSMRCGPVCIRYALTSLLIEGVVTHAFDLGTPEAEEMLQV
ncbi:uncharacterized protein LOC102551486 isoform X1 [Rattus norvegicus]|uniref:uncharacterized protein LOC102551486 isoform X1 n=1 Tax=Rattus norvegicus TaxID=10116 RepID=UPI0003D0F170